MATQAAAIENCGWQQALPRSRELAREHWSHILGLILATGPIILAVEAAANALATGHGATAGPVALGLAITTIRQSFTALTLALLYFDLAARPRVGRAPSPAYQRPRDLEP